MSLKLSDRYPGRFDIPSAGYPQGSFKNRTTPDAKDGSYLEKDWANDKEGFFQSLLSAAGVAPNGNVDRVGSSQFYDALLQALQSQAGVAYTAIGTSTALTIAPSPPATSYSENQRFCVRFPVASGTNPTLNVSSIGPKNLRQYSSTGAKVSAVFSADQISDVVYDGTDFIILDPLSAITQATETIVGGARLATQNEVDNSNGDNLIVTPVTLGKKFTDYFVQATETVLGVLRIATQAQVATGVDDSRAVTSLKLAQRLSAVVVAATTTVSGIARIATQTEVNNSIANNLIVTPLTLGVLLTNYVKQATTAVAGIARIATQAEVNNASAPDLIVTPATFGVSLTGYFSANALGSSQAWQDVTANRSANTTYTNSAGRPIEISIYTATATNWIASITVSGVVVASNTTNNMTSGGIGTLSAIIPVGASYSFSLSATSISKWMELR